MTRTSPVTRASSQPGVRSSPCGSGGSGSDRPPRLASRRTGHPGRPGPTPCPVIGAQHPRTLARMLAGLANPAGSPATPSMRTAAHAEEVLRTAGFAAPPWAALADELSASQPRYFGDTARGWQQAACAHFDRKALETFFTELDPASRATLLSQAGPGGSVAAAALPTRDEFRLQDDTFRCVLLRRLRLPLPLEPRACRCGGALDPLGDHRTACPTAGVLVRRAGSLERAVARVCVARLARG